MLALVAVLLSISAIPQGVIQSGPSARLVRVGSHKRPVGEGDVISLTSKMPSDLTQP